MIIKFNPACMESHDLFDKAQAETCTFRAALGPWQGVVSIKDAILRIVRYARAMIPEFEAPEPVLTFER
jgi:hypothetical protein